VAAGLAPDLRTSTVPQTAEAIVRQGALVAQGMPLFGELCQALTNKKELGVAQVLIAGTLDFSGGNVCEELVRSAAEHIAESREESGCIAYEWTIDPLVPGRLHVFESWASEIALGAHFQHASYRAMVAHLDAQKITAFDVKLYSVAGIETVYTESGQPRLTIFGVKTG
jgi:quinol monooxygenase YgiN